MLRMFSVVFLLAMSSRVLAHPGEHHGGVWQALLHVFSQPDHLAGLILAVVIGVGAAWWMVKRKS